jgi:hypothetical protein
VVGAARVRQHTLFGGSHASDIAGALAVFVRGEGFVVVRSRAAHESDYESALRVATFLMGGGPEQAANG